MTETETVLEYFETFSTVWTVDRTNKTFLRTQREHAPEDHPTVPYTHVAEPYEAIDVWDVRGSRIAVFYVPEGPPVRSGRIMRGEVMQ